MMAKTHEYLFKILLVGDSDVGKTQILYRFTECPSSSTFIHYVAKKGKYTHAESSLNVPYFTS